MPVAMRPWSEEWVGAIREFNRRLDRSTEELRFPERPAEDSLPGTDTFLAIEGDAVRGGFMLRRQCFRLGGQMREVAHYRLPLSEGVADRAYASLGLQMLRTALKAQPLLYALGMSSFDRPLPRMLGAMGWSLGAVPFWFRVVRPVRFLRNIRRLRTTPLRRALLDVAAFSGAGWAGLRLIHAMRTRRAMKRGGAARDFGLWADETWDAASAGYALCAARDSRTLNALYPPGNRRFVRVRAGGGWAVVVNTAMRDHKYFGNMQVGTIVDCLAPPGGEPAVIGAAVRSLEHGSVDLIITNQANQAWCDALRECGFLEGPSNFIFAASRELSAVVGPFGTNLPRFHINRGDGDGPVNL